MEKIKQIKYRNDIQFLRGLAVISVLFFHIDKSIIKFGYIGVDIFFVISGFVISNLIYSNISNNNFQLKKFIFLRFKRIVPALISYLLFVQVLIFFNLDHQNIIETTKTSIYSLLLLSNIHIARYLEYFNQESVNNLVINLWSLSVEEQFYIVFPVFVLLISRLKIAKQLLIYLILIFISIFSNSYIFFDTFNVLEKIFSNFQNYIFYSPLTRAWEFILGVIAMFLNQKKLKESAFLFSKKIGLMMYLLLFISIYSNTLVLSSLTRIMISNILTFLILVFNFDIPLNNYSLTKFIIFSGNISYSLYLWHWGILVLSRWTIGIHSWTIPFQI